MCTNNKSDLRTECIFLMDDDLMNDIMTDWILIHSLIRNISVRVLKTGVWARPGGCGLQCTVHTTRSQ